MSKLATKMAAVSSLRNTKDARCRATAAVLPPLHSGFTLSSKLAPLFKGPGGVDLCLDDGSAETGFELPSPTVPVLTHSSPCSSAFGYAEPTPEPMELSPVTYSGAPDFMVVPHVIGKHCTASPRFEPSASPLPLSSTALSEADPSCSPSASEAFLSEDESSGSESIYRCSIRGCKKGFKKVSLLKAHNKTHVVLRPFECDICRNTFARNHDLKRHVRSVHNVGKTVATKCAYCAKVFSRKDSCAFHMATSCTKRKND